MSDGHINLKLFAAHHPDAPYLSDCCNHYFNEHISIASLIPSPRIIVQPFGHVHDEYEFLLPPPSPCSSTTARCTLGR